MTLRDQRKSEIDRHIKNVYSQFQVHIASGKNMIEHTLRDAFMIFRDNIETFLTERPVLIVPALVFLIWLSIIRKRANNTMHAVVETLESIDIKSEDAFQSSYAQRKILASMLICTSILAERLRFVSALLMTILAYLIIYIVF